MGGWGWMLLISCLSELHSETRRKDCSICLWFQDLHGMSFTQQWGCPVTSFRKQDTWWNWTKELHRYFSFFFVFLFVCFLWGGGSQKLSGDLIPPPKHAHPLLSCSPLSVGLGKWTRSATEWRKEKGCAAESIFTHFKTDKKRIEIANSCSVEGKKKKHLEKIIPTPINFISICHRLVRLCWWLLPSIIHWWWVGGQGGGPYFQQQPMFFIFYYFWAFEPAWQIHSFQ